MTDGSQITTPAQIFERKRADVNTLLGIPESNLTANQPCLGRRLRACGFSIIAADVANLADRIKDIASGIAGGGATNSTDSAAKSGGNETYEVLIPEAFIATVSEALTRLGCKLTSDHMRPKEAFDVYRFHLRLPAESKENPEEFAVKLGSLAEMLFSYGTSLLLEAEANLRQPLPPARG